MFDIHLHNPWLSINREANGTETYHNANTDVYKETNAETW